MSLEAKIEQLTAAVEALTLAFNTQSPALLGAPPVDAEVTEVRVADTAVIEIVPNESLKFGEPSAPAPEQSSPEVTYDDVKKATNNLSAAKGKEVTINALSRFGVKRATELTREQWAPYIDYAGKVTSGDIDG